MADSSMQEALKIFAAEKAEEIASLGGSLSGAKKEAFEQGFLNPLKARPLGVMQEIIDYVPTTGSGFGWYGHDEDDRALEYYEEAKAQNALGGLTVPQKIRVIHELLDGATVGDEETAILDLLAANPSEANQLIQANTWEWLYDDIDDDEHKTFVRTYGPRFWPTQSLDAKAGGGGQARARIHERHRRGDDHHHPADVLAGSGARFQRRHAPEHRSHRRQPGRARPDARRTVGTARRARLIGGPSALRVRRGWARARGP